MTRRLAMVRSHRLRQVTTAVIAIMASTSIAGAQAANAKGKAKATAAGHFKVSAPDLTAKGRITAQHVFSGMGCTGQNVSPALNWSGAPAGTKSFAVTAYDPDAPTGSGWWHWVMYNIPADATGLQAGAGNGRNAPRGSQQGNTDFGSKGYGGPSIPGVCHPHLYHFTVLSLHAGEIDGPSNTPSAT